MIKRSDQRFVISDVCGNSIHGPKKLKGVLQYLALELGCANC